jgi:ribosomal protein S18 acetylase RimI-like enzyme
VVRTRPAEGDSDAAFTRALHDATRRPELAANGLPDEVLTELLPMQYAAREAGYRRQFPDASAEIVLVDGIPAGRVLVDRGDTALHVIDIALMPEHRGHGVGTDVLVALLDEASASSLPLTLSVLRGNPALRLYRRLGFEVNGEDEAYLHLIRRPPVG